MGAVRPGRYLYKGSTFHLVVISDITGLTRNADGDNTGLHIYKRLLLMNLIPAIQEGQPPAAPLISWSLVT